MEALPGAQLRQRRQQRARIEAAGIGNAQAPRAQRTDHGAQPVTEPGGIEAGRRRDIGGEIGRDGRRRPTRAHGWFSRYTPNEAMRRAPSLDQRIDAQSLQLAQMGNDRFAQAILIISCVAMRTAQRLGQHLIHQPQVAQTGGGRLRASAATSFLSALFHRIEAQPSARSPNRC